MTILPFKKSERGTHTGIVRVKRDGKTFTRTQRIGKKTSPRTGTGKMDKFPEAIKNEILEQRGFGESGAKIKVILENLVDTMTEKDRSKMKDLKLIDEKQKLTVTAQALTDWAKKKGVTSSKIRVSAAQKEKSAHAETKKDLDYSSKKIAQLEVAAKHNIEEIKLIQQSKMESDKIRQDLGKENKILSTKLKTCLEDK